ncbi:hypothetical protein PR048_000390 [Dryococelus australis]|uniref:Uncharacterized protein n=1 Tax=Dryococelus australis TaxID=614101 RepID=A0ABQ9IEG7_9NEOP|nr:hypothetical protein PR048_000390 [Dryococelus australis]
MRVIDVSMEQCWSEGVGETGDLRENPPTNGIVRHDSHMRNPDYTAQECDMLQDMFKVCAMGIDAALQKSFNGWSQPCKHIDFNSGTEVLSHDPVGRSRRDLGQAIREDMELVRHTHSVRCRIATQLWRAIRQSERESNVASLVGSERIAVGYPRVNPNCEEVAVVARTRQIGETDMRVQAFERPVHMASEKLEVTVNGLYVGPPVFREKNPGLVVLQNDVSSETTWWLEDVDFHASCLIASHSRTLSAWCPHTMRNSSRPGLHSLGLEEIRSVCGNGLEASGELRRLYRPGPYRPGLYRPGLYRPELYRPELACVGRQRVFRDQYTPRVARTNVDSSDDGDDKSATVVCDILLRAHCFASCAGEWNRRKESFHTIAKAEGRAMKGFESQTRAADSGRIVFGRYRRMLWIADLVLSARLEPILYHLADDIKTNMTSLARATDIQDGGQHQDHLADDRRIKLEA